MNKNPIEFTTPNSLAAVWSMMLPGLGQMMKGRILPGLLWAAMVASGYYSFFWPGITLHALCILDAAFYKGNISFLSLETWREKISFLSVVASLLIYIVVRNNF